MSTPNDREFAYWHRVASENLIQACTLTEREVEHLEISQDYGKRALVQATNTKERMLAMGLLMTVSGIRILIETGLETAALPDGGAT